MDITITLADGVPIYRQIANQIRYLAASGQLAPGEELLPIRTLALQLRVTPNTVVKAYGELEAAGRLEAGWRRHVRVRRPLATGGSRAERILEQRLDALLAEAHHLNFTTDDVLRMFNERRALMTRVPDGELARKEKE